MGHHCCGKQKVKRGLWSPEEDEKLIRCISIHGHGCWSSIPRLAGLQRCGKSCRLRWINYLRPDLKRGSFTPQEERIIIDVHRILGNRWAQIAKHLPGRTDNEVKNFWNSSIKKKLIAQGLDPKTHNLRMSSSSSSSSTHQTTTAINNACSSKDLNLHNHIYQSNPNSSSNPSSSMDFTLNSSDMSMNNNSQLLYNNLYDQPISNISTNFDYNHCYQHEWGNLTFNDHQSYSINSSMDLGSDCLGLVDVKLPISCSSINYDQSGLLNEFSEIQGNCLLWDNNNCESFDNDQLPRLVTIQHPPLPEEEEEEKGSPDSEQQQQQFVNGNEGSTSTEKENSFNSSNFDIEFMGSTIMSGEMYSNITSMDGFQWDC